MCGVTSIFSKRSFPCPPKTLRPYRYNDCRIRLLICPYDHVSDSARRVPVAMAAWLIVLASTDFLAPPGVSESMGRPRTPLVEYYLSINSCQASFCL